MTDAVEIKYSMSELSDLVERSDTCVTLHRKPRVLYLNPMQFSNLKAGIRGSLDSLIFKYDFLFKAIILGYRKIKLLTRYGSFCYRNSKVSLQIEADFYLFNPEVGSKLKGVICKRSGHHLGVLVHKAFTVFLELNENNYETGWDYSLGEDIEFKVVSMDLTSGPLPYIKGKLIKEEKEGDEKEGEGNMVGTKQDGSFSNEWGGSDSGVASSTGRESEDSDDSERNDVSEGSVKKSTIEEWAYNRPHHRKSKGNFGDELMKVMERETASEDESGAHSKKNDPLRSGEISSQELLSPPPTTKKRKSLLKKKKVELSPESDSVLKSNGTSCTFVTGPTSSQDSSSDIPSSPSIPKKRKSILKVQKDISCDTDITGSCSAEISNTSLLIKSSTEAPATSEIPKKRKSLLKKPKEVLSSNDNIVELEITDNAEGYNSPIESTMATSVEDIDDKRIRILRNIISDLSPERYETEPVKSILETLQVAESHQSVLERSKTRVDSPKAVPQSKKQVGILKKKEVISSSDDEDTKESDSQTVVLQTLSQSTKSNAVPVNIVDNGKPNLTPEKQTDGSKLDGMKSDLEKNDGEKKKRKSMSKIKKKTSLLYESIAEKLRESTGMTDEKISETSGKEHGNITDIVATKGSDEGSKKDSRLGIAKDTSPVKSKKKSPKKKASSCDMQEDLVTQLLSNMEKAIVVEDSEDPVVKAEGVSTVSDGNSVDASVTPKAKTKTDPSNKAGKRKSLSSKKGESSLSVEEMNKMLTETSQLNMVQNATPSQEVNDDQSKIAEANENHKVQKRQSLDGTAKDTSKKKTRKSVSNLIPIIEETKALVVPEPLKSNEKVTLSAISLQEDGSKSKAQCSLDVEDSSIKTPKKPRKSMGEKKSKKDKSKEGKEDPPKAEEEETDVQIQKLLMLNKIMIGLDSVDASGDQLDKVSNKEKKSKKRKRESIDPKISPKKRKTAEGEDNQIQNIASS